MHDTKSFECLLSRNKTLRYVQMKACIKLFMTTNHAINGEGASFKDRQSHMAFSDYYNERQNRWMISGLTSSVSGIITSGTCFIT
jgi:hypothetical protein